MLLVPEQIVHSALTKFLAFVKTNYDANTADETKSYIYKIFGAAEMQTRYKYLLQGKELFTSGVDNRRKPEVNLFFNAKHNGVPNIHIMPTTDSPAQGGIGIDQGYAGNDVDLDSEEFAAIFTRGFNSTLSIVLTSDNPSEVSMMYSFIRAALIPMFNHFELSGMRNCALSGSAINLDEHLVPPNIFTKQITISFYNEVESVDFYRFAFINEMNFNLILTDGTES